MSAKHTPGKWTMGTSWCSGDCHVYGPGQIHIASAHHLLGGDGPEGVENPDMEPGVAEANALLISAAPEMLEALRELLRWSGSDDTIAGPEIAARSAARAAIRKATGAEGGGL